MTNNSERIRISWVQWINNCQQAALVNFMVLLNIFKILKILFWIFWRKNGIFFALWALFYLKLYKTFRIGQGKKPRLLKPWLNFDLNFIFKSSGTALLETILSYRPPPSFSQENRKTSPPLPPAPLDTSTTVLVWIFSSIQIKGIQ